MKRKQRHTGGQATYGYMWKGGGLVPNPHKDTVREYIYELYVLHKKKKAVARILNEQGFRTRQRALFSGTSINRMLIDTTVIGKWRTNHALSNNKNTKWTERPEHEWQYKEVPAIISNKLWQKCQLILKEQNSREGIKKESKLYFRDYVVCECNARMKSLTKKQKYLCPSCGNFVEHKNLEIFFISQIKSFELRKNEKKTRKKMRLNKRLLLHLASELTTIKQLLEFDLGHEEESKEIRKLKQQLEQIKITILGLEQKIKEQRKEIEKIKKNQDQKDKLDDIWPSFSKATKERLLERLISNIAVGNRSIKIVFKSTPGVVKI